MMRVSMPGRSPAAYLALLAAGWCAAYAGPSAEFAARRQALFDHALQDRAGYAYSEAFRIAAGLSPNEERIRIICDQIDTRHDCADFSLHSILRLMLQFGDSPLMPAASRDRMKDTILKFKYWPDEPGVDSMCTWSENHYILFASAGYLAGQLYPDEVFSNSGRTGREVMERHRQRVVRWLDLRFHTGFSEWLSNVYYNEDLAATLNLAEFCSDPWIAQRAAMVTDLLLADIALNLFKGGFSSTHGRSYEQHRKSSAQDDTTGVQHLAFGGGIRDAGMAASCLALGTRYRVPAVLEAIANDTGRDEMLNRQRCGIRIADAKRWGLGFSDPEDGMLWFTLEAYAHPKTINLTLDMFDEFNWWQNSFFKPFLNQKPLIDKLRPLGLMPCVARIAARDLARNTREQVDLYTYRTPDYMLSTAQDYRRGYGGDQQHIWQASLGPDAVCFTSHPSKRRRETPNYWTGYGSLPRAVQQGNVLIEVYNIHSGGSLYMPTDFLFTHAWLPQDEFDEFVERHGWYFARKADAYLALHSRQPARWQTEPGPDRNRELIADGHHNVWICELGRRAADGEFSAFMDRIVQARLTFGNLSVTYDSPSQGLLQFGWRRPFTCNGKRVQLHFDMRYDNPYSQTPFASSIIEFRLGDQILRLNWETGERSANALL